MVDRIFTQADALALHARIGGAAFMTIADCGHLAPLERPRRDDAGAARLAGAEDCPDMAARRLI
jgi:pimeloyl-ACP methyl ester carboxylesterase